MVSRHHKNDTTVVKLTISDVNDYAPTFEKSLYVIELPEDKVVDISMKYLKIFMLPLLYV